MMFALVAILHGRVSSSKSWHCQLSLWKAWRGKSFNFSFLHDHFSPVGENLSWKTCPRGTGFRVRSAHSSYPGWTEVIPRSHVSTFNENVFYSNVKNVPTMFLYGWECSVCIGTHMRTQCGHLNTKTVNYLPSMSHRYSVSAMFLHSVHCVPNMNIKFSLFLYWRGLGGKIICKHSRNVVYTNTIRPCSHCVP